MNVKEMTLRLLRSTWLIGANGGQAKSGTTITAIAELGVIAIKPCEGWRSSEHQKKDWLDRRLATNPTFSTRGWVVLLLHLITVRQPSARDAGKSLLGQEASRVCRTTAPRRGCACHGHQPTNRVERGLSEILAADVAGYSRLMPKMRRQGNARGLTLLLNGRCSAPLAQHGCRVVKNTRRAPGRIWSAVEAVGLFASRPASKELTSLRRRTGLLLSVL